LGSLGFVVTAGFITLAGLPLAEEVDTTFREVDLALPGGDLAVVEIDLAVLVEVDFFGVLVSLAGAEVEIVFAVLVATVLVAAEMEDVLDVLGLGALLDEVVLGLEAELVEELEAAAEIKDVLDVLDLGALTNELELELIDELEVVTTLEEVWTTLDEVIENEVLELEETAADDEDDRIVLGETEALLEKLEEEAEGVTTALDDAYERDVEGIAEDEGMKEVEEGTEDVKTDKVMTEEVEKTYCEEVAMTEVLELFGADDVAKLRLEVATVLREVVARTEVLGIAEVAERFSGAGVGIAISKALS